MATQECVSGGQRGQTSGNCMLADALAGCPASRDIHPHETSIYGGDGVAVGIGGGTAVGGGREKLPESAVERIMEWMAVGYRSRVGVASVVVSSPVGGRGCLAGLVSILSRREQGDVGRNQ